MLLKSGLDLNYLKHQALGYGRVTHSCPHFKDFDMDFWVKSIDKEVPLQLLR